MTAPLGGDAILPVLGRRSHRPLPLVGSVAAPCLFPADLHQHALQGDWSASEVAYALQGLPGHELHTCTAYWAEPAAAAMLGPSGNVRMCRGGTGCDPLSCSRGHLLADRPLLALMERPGSGRDLVMDGILTEPLNTVRFS